MSEDSNDESNNKTELKKKNISFETWKESLYLSKIKEKEMKWNWREYNLRMTQIYNWPKGKDRFIQSIFPDVVSNIGAIWRKRIMNLT